MHSALPIQGRLALPLALSSLLAGLLAVSAAAGVLATPWLYPDEALALAFAPVDLLNLVVALPLLLGSMIGVARGRWVWLLCWPGVLLWIYYNEVACFLAVPSGPAAPAHLGLATGSVYTLAALLWTIDAEAVAGRLRGKVPERSAAALLVGLTALFVLRAMALWIGALTGGSPIEPVDRAVMVGDLTTAPAWIAGGVLLWRRRPLGYVLGLGLLLLYTLLFLGLVPLLLYQAHAQDVPLPWGDLGFVGIAGLLLAVPTLRFARAVRLAERA